MNLNSSKSEGNVLRAYNMLLYFAGTMIMWDPSNECIRDFWKNGILKSLPLTSNNPSFITAASLLRESVGDMRSGHEMMKADYQRLFTGSGTPLAPPFESVYRSKDHLMFDSSNGEVREFYRSYGWESKFKNSIPDDHLGIELLFLTLMVEKYLELDDKACLTEMKTEIRRFIDQHIFPWVPEWNRDIQKHAETLSYKGIASLIQACTEDIHGLMGAGCNTPDE